MQAGPRTLGILATGRDEKLLDLVDLLRPTRNATRQHRRRTTTWGVQRDASGKAEGGWHIGERGTKQTKGVLRAPPLVSRTPAYSDLY